MTAVPQETTVANDTAQTNTLVLPKPANLAVGDLMVAACLFSLDSLSDTFAGPSGFAQTYAPVEVQGVNYRWLVSWYKIADASDVGASSFTFTGAAVGYAAGTLTRVTGADTTTPIGQTATNNISGTAMATFPAVTPAVSGGLVLEHFGCQDDVDDWSSLPSDTATDANENCRGADSSARLTALHNLNATTASVTFTPATGVYGTANYNFGVATVVIQPAAAPARTQQVRVSGAWVAKPVKVRSSGAWV